ncbi:hypothetical protein AB0A74_24815 [Saccharothrix sp. NPDC042600]|uniref:hypothetical protein n=1 Tax=Saccharothrix TaxID=2071 RepID=UPI0033E67B22|nr:hypothetical protein GCM10017745_17920 [Saccharothrix mutabilis subsp. capreolus]
MAKNAQDDGLIHIEKSRSLWDGHSKTMCGRRIEKAEAVWVWFTSRKWCPICEAHK